MPVMNNIIRIKVHRLCLIILSLLSIVGCDQATKTVAKDTLSHAGPLSYLGDTVRLQYMENPGAFLSLGATLPLEYRFWIFSVAVSICLLAAAFFLLFKRTNVLLTLGLALTVGGGIGNLIDRLTSGRVVDFINVGIGSFRTGIFNIADVAIMVGIGLMVIDARTCRTVLSVDGSSK